LNVAVTVLPLSNQTVQEPTPVQGPLQPTNVEPLAAAAVSVTLDPASKSPAQLVPQVINPPLTVPAPAPDLSTVSVNLGIAGVTLFESTDCAPVPATFFAATRNVYAVPFVKPPKAAWVTTPTLIFPLATPAAKLVTSYPVIAAPPLNAGALQLTVAWPDPAAVADTLVGASGTVRGVTALESMDCAPVPIAFFAATRNVYAVPFVKLLTVVCVTTPTLVVACATPPT
jgi:hypothetical protein